MRYETVVGIETHVELKTNTKAFCSCSTEFGGEPNTRTCPVCAGFPGTLPVLNKRVVEFAIRAGLALNCDIQRYNRFDRKNYFYPDLAKGYQISQLFYPICLGGHVDIEVNGEKKRIRLNRIHIEEDAGKLVHSGASISTSDSSVVDYNRSSVPLLEIVSEPDIRSAEEAKAYMEKMRTILEYIDVSDCKMQEGSLRCDANVSIRPFGQEKFGTRSEIKNLNSFRSVQRGVDYEVLRQTELVEDGGTVVQETRTWDEEAGVTRSMRSKEEAHDYRYFPDPNLTPFIVEKEWVESVRAEMPELPDARKERLMDKLGLSDYDASGVIARLATAQYFDRIMEHTKDAKSAANWILGDIAAWLNNNNLEMQDLPVKPENIARMIELINGGVLSSKLAKTVFAEMVKEDKAPEDIVKEKGLEQISDTGAIEAIVDKIIAANPQSVTDFKAGKDKALGFLVGQIMRESRGKANPEMVNSMLKEKMS